MSKNKYLHDNFYVNLILKGFTSILIGCYFFGGAFLMKSILDGFLVDDNPLGMLSAEIIEMLFLVILLAVFIFSSIALVFGGRRVAKKYQYKLWNSKTKKTALIYLLIVLVTFTTLVLLLNSGFVNYLTPAFLILYGLLLFLLKNKDRKQIFILSGLAFALALICFLIPGYWNSALSILGIAHIAYGVVVK
jgi:hypothetical protein